MTREPTTLDQLQSLETDDFADIDRYLYGGDVSASRVIDHIIELAARELEWQGRQDAGSLRDFWYNPVKPILEAAVPEWKDGAGSSTWNRGMSKRLSKRLSEKVKDPESGLSYRDLNILDDSRDRRIASSSLENDKIIFVEKSAAYRKLEPLADVYDVTLVEGSGWSATALIEDLERQLPEDVEFTFYVLGDYDPTGFGIVDDFVNRAEKLGIKVNEEASRRVGVRPEQVDDETVRDQKFTVGGSNNEEWKEEHGIDGEYGLEIEAVGDSLGEKAEALRELVVDEIRDDIDADGRRVRDVANSASRVPSGAAQSLVSDIVDDLERELAKKAASIYAEADGVTEAKQTFGTSTSVTVDTEAVLAGETDDDYVPTPYDESRLHSGAVSGNKPSASGRRSCRRQVKDDLREKIDDGEIDVSELLNS